MYVEMEMVTRERTAYGMASLSWQGTAVQAAREDSVEADEKTGHEKTGSRC
jgi:uncharacterized protein YkwD